MTLRTHLRRKKIEYLLLQGKAGGDRKSFKQHIKDDYAAHPGDYKPLAAVMVAAAQIWEENPKPDPEPDFFAILGVPVAHTLTYPDPAQPDHFRKIHQNFATVLHLREDAEVTIASGQTIVDAGNSKKRIAEEALRRAGGDLSKLISEIVD